MSNKDKEQVSTRKVVQMVITPPTHTWQECLLLLCDDGTIWTEAAAGRWDLLPLPPGCAQQLQGETSQDWLQDRFNRVE